MASMIRYLRSPFRYLLLLAVLCLGSSGPAWAGGIAADLQAEILAAPDLATPRRVIVQFSQTGVDSSVLALAYGGTSLQNLAAINGALLEVPQSAITALAADVLVSWVSPDRLIFRQWDQDVPTVGADQVWVSPGYRGSGVRVAVLDTGVYANTFEWNILGGSGSRIAGWKDLVNGQQLPYDDNGHGTHVAGVVLGSGSASGGSVSGIAPDAALVAVKVLGNDGSGRVSTIIRGIEWCIQNRSALGIRVLNMSLGHRPSESTQTDPLCKAVRRAVRSGLVVVCSAGNRGKNSDGEIVYGGISSPGNEPAAITVGALNTRATADRSDDRVCTFSSRGPTYGDHHAKPDLLAPGNWIVSVRSPGSYLDTLHSGNRIDADTSTPDTVDYFRLSGTSTAAPQVAGAVALMLQANPALAPNTVKGALMYTAERLDLRDAAGNPLSRGLSLLTQGAGSLNAVGAVELAAKIDASAAVGTAWLREAPSNQTVIGGRAFAWRVEVFWGGRVYSGGAVFGYRQTAWTEQSTWGDGAAWDPSVSEEENGVSAEQSTWGDESAWHDPMVWSDQSTWGDDTTPTVCEDPHELDGGTG